MSQTRAQILSPVGILTVSGISASGIITASSFSGNLTGTSTGLSGTPNLNVGVVTASSFSGNLTGTSTGLSGTPNVNAGIVTSTKLDVSGNYTQTIQTVSALDINCSLGNYFIKTIGGNSTFTFSSVPSSRAFSFTLELTHTSGSVTWPETVKWPGDTAPTLTTGKTHLLFFVTDDGGTRWRGAALADYVN